MPHCAPGKRFVTAAASRCAVLCRNNGSASALSGVTMRTDAGALRGYVRSTRRSSTTAATAALASRGEIAAATSRTGVPGGTLRLDPSGSVTVISVIESAGCLIDRPPSRLRRFRLRALRYGGQVGGRNALACQPKLAASRHRRAKVGRRGWTRTTDLLRVREAL